MKQKNKNKNFMVRIRKKKFLAAYNNENVFDKDKSNVLTTML